MTLFVFLFLVLFFSLPQLYHGSLLPLFFFNHRYFVRNLIDPDPETRRVALVAIQSLGPAAKRFYPQLIARLEDEESHLRYLASATLACTFPPAAASRLIVHKMEAGGEGKKQKPSQKHSTTNTAADLKKRTNVKVKRLPTKVKEVYVNALSKLLTGSHRKYVWFDGGGCIFVFGAFVFIFFVCIFDV